MQNKYLKFLLIALIVAIVVPQITLAAWWNPMSWGIWNRIFHFQQQEQKQEKLIGGDKDAHGCLIAAGYTWCEVKNKCLRTFEEKCEADQTAGWKTYTNTEYRFSIKYPINWVIYKENSEIGEHSVFLGPEANYVQNIRTEESGCSVILAVFNNSEKLSLSDWLAKNDMWNQKPVKGITNIKINGAEGIKYEGTDYGMGGVTPIGFDSHVLFSKNDKIIDILTLDKCADKTNTNKINSTFKFTK
ncbi:MAG: PsbP-related protein [Candidatus Staskawiczbacteria bacterium]|nr:PsbP-related protein [Candidatus Staskawiczbacteria bacterium]